LHVRCNSLLYSPPLIAHAHHHSESITAGTPAEPFVIAHADVHNGSDDPFFESDSEDEEGSKEKVAKMCAAGLIATSSRKLASTAAPITRRRDPYRRLRRVHTLQTPARGSAIPTAASAAFTLTDGSVHDGRPGGGVIPTAALTRPRQRPPQGVFFTALAVLTPSHSCSRQLTRLHARWIASTLQDGGPWDTLPVASFPSGKFYSTFSYGLNTRSHSNFQSPFARNYQY